MISMFFAIGTIMFLNQPTPNNLNIESVSAQYEYDYEYDSQTDEEFPLIGLGFLAVWGTFMVGMYAFAICISLLTYVYMALALSTIAKKVGEENTWFAWVPFLNFYLMILIAKVEPWMIILIFVPFANLAITIYLWMKIAERRGFPNWVVILFLVPGVGLAIPGYIAWGEPQSLQ